MVDEFERAANPIPRLDVHCKWPKNSEAGYIFPISNSPSYNPVFGRGVKYRCIQRAGSPTHWCVPFYHIVARRCCVNCQRKIAGVF